MADETSAGREGTTTSQSTTTRRRTNNKNDHNSNEQEDAAPDETRISGRQVSFARENERTTTTAAAATTTMTPKEEAQVTDPTRHPSLAAAAAAAEAATAAAATVNHHDNDRDNNNNKNGSTTINKEGSSTSSPSTTTTTTTFQRILQHPSTAHVGIPLGSVFLYAFACHPLGMTRWLLQFLSRLVAWALGIALGAGWAMHVYEQLDLMTQRQRQQEEETNPTTAATTTPLLNRQRGLSNVSTAGGGGNNNSATTGTPRQIPPPPTLNASPSSNLLRLEDEQTYASIMQAAGYPVDQKILRGQVCKTADESVWKINYPFVRGSRSLQMLQGLFPSLPDAVRTELARFMEHLMRDFVSSWYSLLDNTVSYQDERVKRQEAAAATAQSSPSSSSPPQRSRRMLYRMAPHRQAPFMDRLYETLTVAFGNLATRVEHVNVLELALLKWTKILAHTFKTYRHLRRIRLGKHQHHQQAPLTEMDVTKEFLFAGKLHKAVTFGLDVPALLFADAEGKECTVEGIDPDQVLADENAVLEARLFQSGILQECELDYNRVVAHRIVRALLPRADFGSPLVSSLVTEIMASCVLNPLMGCFCPDYLNAWIVSGLAESATTSATETAPEAAVPDEPVDDDKPESAIDATTTNGQQSERVAAAAAAADPLVGSLEEDLAKTGEGVDASMTSIPEGHAAGPSSLDANELIPASSAPTGIIGGGGGGSSSSDFLVSQLARVLIELQDYMDLPEMRAARRESRQGPAVDWDDSGCRAVILQLVLVLEAALMDGRCTYRVRNPGRMFPDGDEDDEVDMDDSDRPVEVTLTQYESTTFSQLLMELTSDIEAFEERVATENTVEAGGELAERVNQPKDDSDHPTEIYKPTAIEQSTLRTLIAAWLHTGQVYRTMMVLTQAHATVLAPYYHERAFLRSRPDADDFLRVLHALDGVDILVDTMSIMNSPRLDEGVTNEDGDLSAFLRHSPPRPTHRRSDSDKSIDTVAMTNSLSIGSSFMSNASTPRHVDFHRNEAFAASLRSERDRRTQSWYSLFEGAGEEGVPIICHTRGVTDEDAAAHRELHHLARIFYSGTNLISIRDAARRNSADDRAAASSASSTAALPVSLLTVEMASPRRRIEVPDDDSSFLLRAQPRPLNAVGVHRDQRNHDQSFKCFAGTYEEPALSTEHFSGGRYMRYCLIRYYPIDRTASIALHADVRRVDQRKTKVTVPDTITVGSTPSRQTPFLSGEFLRERHLCQRWVPRGTTRTQSILASSVMEPTDFTSQPRTGRAMDFVYRMSFFEKPMIELGGKIFTVHDSSSFGTHRADASGLEMSDAALGASLLSLGESSTDDRQIEMGEDGYPIVWMKFSRKQDDAHIEVRPYRVSFIRAALLVTVARQEAQLQSLIACVKAGSAKKATKALTDATLKPTLRLLEYAGTRSREKQSLLLRDMKLGVNHIDREQLRRNGLLDPRYPTSIQELFVTVEDCFSADEIRNAELFGSSGVVYQIRVAAIVTLVADEDELGGSAGYRSESGVIASAFREEWVVYRTFKEFQTLHRHLKSQVSTSESSGTAVSRLSATLNATSGVGRRHRSALIPSLSQASKIGALGLTKKSLQKRREYLDGYLSYLFAPDHLLNRCPELLLFVGAFYPLPYEVKAGHVLEGVPDPLGRTKMTRAVLRLKSPQHQTAIPGFAPPSPPRRQSRSMSQGSVDSIDSAVEGDLDADIENPKKTRRHIDMIPAIRNKIDKVPLSQVRNRIFELLRYQFGFENASFVRNRMLAALKTASFAVTSASEFRRTLYNLHTEHLSSTAVARWIKLGLDLLWPDGLFMQSSPPLTPEQLFGQAQKSKELLHQTFPDALRAVLGQELTKDGLNVLHEMLQNRLVVKSMFYQLFDLLWLEVFPEIADVLQGGAALDLDV